jgi:hypothetical protein
MVHGDFWERDLEGLVDFWANMFGDDEDRDEEWELEDK